MDESATIFVAGHRGLVGSAIVRALKRGGHENLLLRSRQELDLRDRKAVASFFAAERPQYVFLAAARVGEILANDTYPVEFLVENLDVQSSVLLAAKESGVGGLLFLGSSCIYPRLAPQPIREESLLDGHLEPTNEAYAIAKIAGITLCQALAREYGCRFICAMPTNLYGAGDNFDLASSHVLPAMLRKFHAAKMSGHSPVTLWGTGTPRREFLHVDDLADACLFLMDHYEDPGIINVGTGEDVSIRELAEMIGAITGYSGEIAWDKSKPDGTPRKLLDVSRLSRLGWRHRIELADGIRQVYEAVDKSGWAAQS